MNVLEIKIDDLTAYINNPRNNDNAVDAVAASIKEFGFKVPVIVDSNNVIIAGHTRVKAARRLGLSVVPCIVADDLSPEQIRAFRLADNKVAELSGWDFARLNDELANIGLDMEQFGFAAHEDIDIDSFFEEAEPKEKEPKRIQCPHCGELVDSAVFVPLAFVGNMPVEAMAIMIATQIPLKVAYEILILPVTARLVKKIANKEALQHGDVY